MKKYIGIILCGILASLCANSYAQDTIEYNDLYTEKQEVEEQIEASEQELEELQQELSSNLQQLQKLDERIRASETEVEKLNSEIDLLKSELAKVELEFDEIEKMYQIQKELLDTRMISMYETSSTTYLDVLLKSKDLGEFLSGIFFITELINYDKNLLEDVQIQKEAIETAQKRLDRDRESIALKISQQTTTNNLLQNTKTLREKYVANLDVEEKEIQAKIDEFYEQFEYIDSQILIYASQMISEEYVGGEFAWPVPGYTVITSYFGMRTHPITGVYKLHTGIDVSAPTGANFVAANDGVVVSSGYNGAYGNMIIIDHGGGIMTLYAHGSEILVETGEQVTRNQPILKVGSTGYSTGPHAHFEVRVNGVFVDPLPYITNQINVESDEETIE